MRRKRARHQLGPALLALLATVASQTTAVAKPAALSVTETVAIERAAAVGRQLSDYDQAASESTDALLAQVPRERLNSVRGWVVQPEADGALAVTYFSGEGSPRMAVFVATVTGSKLTDSRLVPEAEAVPLTPAQERLAAAVGAARAHAEAKNWQPCTPARFNTVALPPAARRGLISVYLLSPQVRAGELPFGGHYRVDVAEDGRLVAERPYTKACLTMPRPATGTAGVVVTHLRSVASAALLVRRCDTASGVRLHQAMSRQSSARIRQGCRLLRDDHQGDRYPRKANLHRRQKVDPKLSASR